jgi:hypothetical protein
VKGDCNMKEQKWTDPNSFESFCIGKLDSLAKKQANLQSFLSTINNILERFIVEFWGEDIMFKMERKPSTDDDNELRAATEKATGDEDSPVFIRLVNRIELLDALSKYIYNLANYVNYKAILITNCAISNKRGEKEHN